MTVDIQEAQGGAGGSDALLGERPPELRGATERGEAGELATEGLDFGRAVESQEPAQILG